MQYHTSEICQDDRRDKSIICVCEEPSDIQLIEKTGFKGVYHVIGGLLSPLDGIGPDDLNLDSLLVSSNQKIDFIFFLNVDKDTIYFIGGTRSDDSGDVSGSKLSETDIIGFKQAIQPGYVNQTMSYNQSLNGANFSNTIQGDMKVGRYEGAVASSEYNVNSSSSYVYVFGGGGNEHEKDTQPLAEKMLIDSCGNIAGIWENVQWAEIVYSLWERLI